MASLDDILTALNTANGRLDDVKASIDSESTAITTAVNGTTAAVNAGFAQLVTLGQYTNQALFHLSQQNDTIICALEHISRNTCDLVTQSHIQTGLQEKIADCTCKLADLYASVHAEAELQRHRLHELREEIERCCPPKKPPPACSYQPCPTPGRLPPPPPPSPIIEAPARTG